MNGNIAEQILARAENGQVIRLHSRAGYVALDFSATPAVLEPFWAASEASYDFAFRYNAPDNSPSAEAQYNRFVENVRIVQGELMSLNEGSNPNAPMGLTYVKRANAKRMLKRLIRDNQYVAENFRPVMSPCVSCGVMTALGCTCCDRAFCNEQCQLEKHE